MLCQTKGLSICPIHLYAPYVWMPLVCMDAPIWLDAPIVCLDAQYVWMAACMFGCPPYVLMPSYVWMPLYVLDPHMFGCPPLCWIPHMFVWLLYVWTPTICLDVPPTFGCHHTFGSIQTYRGAAKHMEDIQTYRGFPIMWGIQPY